MVTTNRETGDGTAARRARAQSRAGRFDDRHDVTPVAPSPSGVSVTDITSDREFEGAPHAWEVLPNGSVLLKLPGDREMRLSEEAPGLWVLRSGSQGAVQMTVTGVQDLAAAMGSVVFRTLARHPRRQVRAVQIIRGESANDGQSAIRKRSGNTWLVPSASTSGVNYTVDISRGTCSCPDNRFRGNHCKHLLAVTMLSGNDGPSTAGQTAGAGIHGQQESRSSFWR